jgi:cobalt-zinc-cadmium efflux system outer membrane protein
LGLCGSDYGCSPALLREARLASLEEFFMIDLPFARRRLHVCIAFALGCPLSGCATTAGSSAYGSLDSDFERSERGRAVASAREDERVMSAAVLDGRAYVRAVLERNPSLESARQAWRAAVARVHQAGGFEDPTLDLGLAPLSLGSSKAPLGYELGISQKLPWFGKRGLEAAASAAEAEASKSDYESVKRELALGALTLFEQYFVLTRSLEINAHHVELMRSMLDGATAQFVAGRGSAQDTLQAESELAHLEHDAAVITSQRDVTVAQMNELLHRSPELLLPPPPRELPLSAEVYVDPGRLEQEAVVLRPDIAAMRHHVQAEQARVDRAAREYYPDLTLSTSYNSMWDTPEHRWMVGVGLNLPLQTGRRAGIADEASAARAQFESELGRLSDAARTQVFVALKQLEESRHVLELFEKRLTPLARERVDAARAGFVSSQSSFLMVIDAEKELRGVELDYQVARAECHRHQAELERALGRIPGLAERGGDR